MNPLVKKEIRLLLPAWSVAVLLAMVQAITRPYDFYVASLLFFGLTIMALSTIGRETSLNTFSVVLAQPVERARIWQIKLSVLAAAFLSVFTVWLVAFGVAFVTSRVNASDFENSYNLFITVCIIATATFTGGLWTTLLMRQLAGAFWLTLLVPATLSGISCIFFANSESSSLVIAVLSVVIGIYSIAGFLFARRLFFRAQDVGWSGGIVELPEWKLFTASAKAKDVRKRQPVFALFKKELQLQQGVLTGAVGLFVLHAGIIGLRACHEFRQDSAGEILTSIFWMLWLVLPTVLGSMAVAEERKLGVMESQQCLSVSRRAQFAIKAFVTMGLGIFLGGVMPGLLESIGCAIGARNPMFMSLKNPDEMPAILFLLGCLAASAWLTLISFFASSFSKNFLQAIGFALVMFIGGMSCLPALTNNQAIFYDSVAQHSILPLIIAVPIIPATLLWLAGLNYARFGEGWPLWRRNLLGLAGAVTLVLVSANLVYHRAWEAFERDPVHGPARLTQSNAHLAVTYWSGSILVRLPDGRVRFDYLVEPAGYGDKLGPLLHWSVSPLPRSAGLQKFISGSNWIAAAAGRIDELYQVSQHGSNEIIRISGFSDSVGIQHDGTLWVSDKSDQQTWTADKLTQFGNETDWQDLAMRDYFAPVLLLKKDGTLWEWGPVHLDPHHLPARWPGLRAFQPRQIGTGSDWIEITAKSRFHARRSDGSVWAVELAQNGNDELRHEAEFDFTSFQAGFSDNDYWGAYVRTNGTLWITGHDRNGLKTWQRGTETNWVSVTAGWGRMVALKSDGTLWKWNEHYMGSDPKFAKPSRLDAHTDWVALAEFGEGVVILAADGSLWFWPDIDSHAYQQALLQVPNRPKFLGNVFNGAN